MTKKILWLLSLIFMISMNALAISLPLNNITTKQLSDNLFTLITPAGFTFGIWWIIYLWVIIVTILLLTNKIFFSNKAYIYFIIWNILNGLWIVAWHYGNLHLSILIIVGLLISLIFLDQENKRHAEARVRNIFLIYFWRVQIATLLMTIVYLQYQLWVISTTSEQLVAVRAIVLAWILNLLVLYKERNVRTSVVAVRALRWIINWQNNYVIINTSYVVIIVLWIYIIRSLIFEYKNKIYSIDK